MKNSTKTYLTNRFHRSLSVDFLEEIVRDIKKNEGMDLLYIFEKALKDRKTFLKRDNTHEYINKEIKRTRKAEPGRMFRVIRVKE